MKHNINPSKYYLYLSNGKITGVILWSNESDLNYLLMIILLKYVNKITNVRTI